MTYFPDSFDEPQVATHALMRSRIAAREAVQRRRWLWRAVLAVGVVAAAVIWSHRSTSVVVSEEEMARRTAPAMVPAVTAVAPIGAPSEEVAELPLVAPDKLARHRRQVRPRSSHR